jgi:hypothetical protein
MSLAAGSSTQSCVKHASTIEHLQVRNFVPLKMYWCSSPGATPIFGGYHVVNGQYLWSVQTTRHCRNFLCRVLNLEPLLHSPKEVAKQMNEDDACVQGVQTLILDSRHSRSSKFFLNSQGFRACAH